MSYNRFNGINLIELLVALVIVSILALISIPVFNSFIISYRLSATADNLYYNLQYARSEAIKNNTTIYVSFNPGDTWCYGINANSACNCTVPNSCGLATVSYATAQQISLSTNGMAGNAINFEGSHASANASGSVTLTKYGQTSPLVTISIGRLGGLTMCSTGVTGYTGC